MRALFSRNFFIFHFSFFILFSSCAVSQKISHQVDKILLKDSVISTGHIGISIYEPATNTYWYNYNATQNFIPASNTKLFTLYAGMKYLGDSLVGLRYYRFDSSVYILPTGDPSFLHEGFQKQPVLDFLKKEKQQLYITSGQSKINALGKGWAWDDYNDGYMAERSIFPLHGNTVKIKLLNYKLVRNPYLIPAISFSLAITPSYFEKRVDSFFTLPFKKTAVIRDSSTLKNKLEKLNFDFIRNREDNVFKSTEETDTQFSEQEIPFITNNIKTAIEILSHDYKIKLSPALALPFVQDFTSEWRIPINIYSQPSDSLFKPMMHNSDNFFAEQTLLMVSNEKLGYMSDEGIIDTLLKNDLKDIPQQPRWVDGSGLSRYNLFTPQDFVYILNKMKNEFGLERLKRILPTGGQGTLNNYYISDSTYIYAKTGSMSNQSTISGLLITKKNKLLIFSVLANNFQGRATLVRRSVECFLQQLRNKY